MTETYTPKALPVDPAEAHALLSSLMRRYTKHAEHKAMIAKSAQEQLTEITEWADEEEGKDGSAMAELEAQMRVLAEVVVQSDPKGRKTVSLPGGAEVCFRAGRESIEVASREAFSVLPSGYLRISATPPPEIDKAAIADGIRAQHIAVNDDGSLSLRGEDGERIPIPGVRLVKAEETFTVKPRA